MHRLLILQLRHDLGIEDAGHWLALTQAIGALSIELAHDDPVLAQALTRMPALLERISSTYGQHERHLSLLRSSLKTSTRELSEVHEALRAELAGKARSLQSPPYAIGRWTGIPAGHESDQKDIDRLAEKLVFLSRDRGFMQQALASIGDGALVTDRHGHIRFLNNGAEQLTGWTMAEAEGVNAAEVAMLLDTSSGSPLYLHPVLRCRLEKAAIGGAPPAMLLTQDHRLVTVAHTASPILSGNGRLAGIVMILRDLSRACDLAPV